MGSLFQCVLHIITQVRSETFSFLLGMTITKVWEWVNSKYVRRQFKRVFGPTAKEFHLAFGSMVVRPDLVNLAASSAPPLARFPFAKPGQVDMAFSAQEVASGCEIRAVSYLVSALKRDGGVSPTVVTDNSIADKLDLNFISFGAMSNLKTIQVFADAANRLAEYDAAGPGYFVSKVDRKPLYVIRKGYDYGVILRIHPKQFPDRSWICCAGWGEWGTSGSAWFLANKWKEIAPKVKPNDQFLGVFEVEIGKDESAKLLSVTPRDATIKP